MHLHIHSKFPVDECSYFQDDEAAPGGSAKQKAMNKFGHTKQGRGFDAKKQWKSQKFGYGGKKKGSKRNDKER